MAKNFEVVCPCCESLIVIDRISGEVLLHKVKEKKQGGSLESMVGSLEAQREEAARRFERQIESQKDRARLLEEKFREALERVDRSERPPRNPLDD